MEHPSKSDLVEKQTNSISETIETSFDTTSSSFFKLHGEYEDSTSTLLMAGGTAIAVAVTAAGALRYKEEIRHVLIGLARSFFDAKDALFEG
jgi:hypothetical protein